MSLRLRDDGGVSARRAVGERPDPSPDSKEPTAGRNGGRTRRRELVENELHERAAELFAERGFAGTSLQDIADAMGTSRTALYHYVRNKDDLLANLVAEVSQELARELGRIRRESGLSTEEQLRRMAGAIVAQMVTRSARFRLLILSEQDLPEALAAVHRDAKRAVRDELATVIAEGVGSGIFRPVDARVAAYAIVGMCNWVAWWFHPGPDHPIEPVVEQIATMALLSVRSAEDGALHDDGPSAALARLRADLAYLERVIAPPG